MLKPLLMTASAAALAFSLSSIPLALAAAAGTDCANPDIWLCRPGRTDACGASQDATIIAADGSLSREVFHPAKNPPIDCFYVYPTVSTQTTGNSDLTITPAEKNVVNAQFARFASQCRLFAPMYRQVTLTALRLLRLIEQEIDGKPVQSQLLSAILMGANVPLPKGEDVGGAFMHIPVCRANSQLGCVIAFADFRAAAPPPANSRFGIVPDGQQAACANPAALAGGSEPYPWTEPTKVIDTSFVKVPGLLSAQCVVNEHGSYLSVTLHPTPGGARANDISGDVRVRGEVLEDWGLHLIDANLNMGNLIGIVGTESKAYLARRK